MSRTVTPIMRLKDHLIALDGRPIRRERLGADDEELMFWVFPGGRILLVQEYESGGFECYTPLSGSLDIATNLREIAQYVKGE